MESFGGIVDDVIKDWESRGEASHDKVAAFKAAVNNYCETRCTFPDDAVMYLLMGKGEGDDFPARVTKWAPAEAALAWPERS